MRTVVTSGNRRVSKSLIATGASLASLLGLLVATAVFGHPLPASAQEAPARPSTEPAVAKEPVILLTGFEPFGKHRLPNASWQGIKGLDGQKRNGYRIVAREMPVVWGAPMECLPRWIDEYKPVAIFSFGMGMPGAFAVETVGHNRARTHQG